MRYLGVDFGLKRVGLATSEGSFTSPFKIIEVRSFKDAVMQIGELVRQEKFDQIIVGLPEGKMSQAVLGFVKALQKLGLDVLTFDETLSSQKATMQMIESNISKEKRRKNDATAAAIILQDWLDSR
ncbi:Holliday junction resolvase RuvX [Candidatus Daviesbacteria bacterium]|nr:Holliday junction resolvase RuvX [Candidatus Daviesbacteria bacterium]